MLFDLLIVSHVTASNGDVMPTIIVLFGQSETGIGMIVTDR